MNTAEWALLIAVCGSLSTTLLWLREIARDRETARRKGKDNMQKKHEAPRRGGPAAGGN